jgi:hypothetical protein
MVALRFPEVLAHDWLPPVLLGRTREVGDVVRRLDAPAPRAEPPWIVGVAGPSGAGTSAVARRAARETVDRLRAFRAEPAPRSWAVRVGNLRGTHGVATGLLRHLDEGFDGRGFPVAEILAGFLRRARREGRPTVLVLDDLTATEPDLAPILRALGNPDRFLPEGQSGLPPFWTIVAGTPDALARLGERLTDRIPFGPFVRLAPYDERTLAGLVADRAERALGRPLTAGIAPRIVTRCLEEGGGARRAIDLLRRELLRGSIGGLDDTLLRLDPAGVSVEPRVVRAIGAASCGVAALLGDVKRCEADLARAQGQRPLPTTTLWRRIVRLERAGYVKREIRTGGNGGTRSLVRVLTPIDEWVTNPHPRDSLRDAGPWTGTGSPVGSPGPSPLSARPGWFPGPNGA